MKLDYPELEDLCDKNGGFTLTILEKTVEANCIKLNVPVKTESGYKMSYRLPYVAIKSNLFKKGKFGSALSTSLHELSHSFGGHKSKHFIRALSDILDISLVNALLLTQFEVLWDKVKDDEE
ncbi:MAG: hypothetical protein ABFS56_15580 [Pseudomonadota bacterium]